MNRGKIIFLYGVHGSGKTLLGEIFSEDEGLEYVKADAIEMQQDVTRLSPLERQLMFKSLAEASYVKAFSLASKGYNVIVDFGPFQIIPYVRWWVKDEEKASEIETNIKSTYRLFRKLYRDVRVLHVFLVVNRENGYDIIVSRILKRNRPNVSEEADVEYIKFIDNSLKEVSRRLREEGEEVYEIEATDKYIDKYKKLEEILHRE